MRMTKSILIAFLVPLSINSVIAQELCKENDTLCFNKSLENQKSRVNLTFNQALKSLPANRKTQLEKSQTAWTTFMTENCKAYIEPNIANNNILSTYECSMNAMKKREIELREKLCSDPVTNCPDIK